MTPFPRGVRQGHVDVWVAAIGDHVDRWLDAILSPDELARRDRFAYGSLRAAFTARRAFRRLVLALYVDESPDRLAFTETAHGKPRLVQSRDAVHFSASASPSLAVVAVGSAPLGIDVEAIDPVIGPDIADIAARWLSPEDTRAIAHAAPVDRMAVFYQRWARFEADLKVDGMGLAGAEGQPQPARHDVVDLSLDNGHACALATSVPRGSVEILSVLAEGPPGRLVRADLRRGSRLSGQ